MLDEAKNGRGRWRKMPFDLRLDAAPARRSPPDGLISLARFMSTATGFEPQHRFDFFEPGEKTALVCLDVPEMQRLVHEQLDSLGYRIHTGLFLDDSLLKVRAHPYDVVVVSEHFGGLSLGDHAILQEAAAAPAAQRRRQVYVLVGADCSTNDDLQAFAHSVDLVVGLADLANLRPVLRRAVARQAEFYAPMHELLGRLARPRPKCGPESSLPLRYISRGGTLPVDFARTVPTLRQHETGALEALHLGSLETASGRGGASGARRRAIGCAGG